MGMGGNRTVGPPIRYPQQRTPAGAPPPGSYNAAGIYGSADQLERQSQQWMDEAPAGYDNPVPQTPLELLLEAMGLNGDQQNGGSGRGGSGGSGSAGGVSPETINAYKQMLDAINSQGAAEMAGFDQRGTSLTALQGDAETRRQAIMAQLEAQRAQSQAAAHQAFANTGSQLSNLAAQYAQGASARDAGMNRSLNAFGVEGLNGGSGGDLANMMGALQGTNAQLQGVSDQGFINSGQTQAALGSDVQQQYQQMFTQLQAQLQAQRQQAQIADAQRKAQLALEAASNGVTL